MRFWIFILSSVLTLISCQPVERQFEYPETKTVEQSDLLHVLRGSGTTKNSESLERSKTGTSLQRMTVSKIKASSTTSTGSMGTQ